MKIKQLEKKIGTLSNPSKMPAYAWGISAKKCITGSLLAEQEGTICNKCYAEIILPARFELPQFKTNLKKVKK